MTMQGNPSEVAASVMTNETLAHRVSMIAGNRRSLDKQMADAVLLEAAKRLQWADQYNRHLTSFMDAMLDPEHHKANVPCQWCGAEWKAADDGQVMDHNDGCRYIAAHNEKGI